MKHLIYIIIAYFFVISSMCGQKKSFTQQEIDLVKQSCDGISGPGKPVIGDGRGGWRTGSEGIQYNGLYPADARWQKMDPSKTTGSVIEKGLLPRIKPLMELHLRDAVICLGGDGNYYLTGSWEIIFGHMPQVWNYGSLPTYKIGHI